MRVFLYSIEYRRSSGVWQTATVLRSLRRAKAECTAWRRCRPDLQLRIIRFSREKVL